MEVRRELEVPVLRDDGRTYHGRIDIYVTGNGFLYNMVRIIAGTLIDVGTGKIKSTDIPAIIESRDRSRAGNTAPAKGLTLMKYDFLGADRSVDDI